MHLKVGGSFLGFNVFRVSSATYTVHIRQLIRPHSHILSLDVSCLGVKVPSILLGACVLDRPRAHNINLWCASLQFKYLMHDRLKPSVYVHYLFTIVLTVKPIVCIHIYEALHIRNGSTTRHPGVIARF